ncbi:unnamed protein product [Symbiodinium sp. CCMP2592]|nr:unnamed protein product [Symbiodinium sp. CCMP2592]
MAKIYDLYGITKDDQVWDVSSHSAEEFNNVMGMLYYSDEEDSNDEDIYTGGQEILDDKGNKDWQLGYEFFLKWEKECQVWEGEWMKEEDDNMRKVMEYEKKRRLEKEEKEKEEKEKEEKEQEEKEKEANNNIKINASSKSHSTSCEKTDEVT